MSVRIEATGVTLTVLDATKFQAFQDAVQSAPGVSNVVVDSEAMVITYDMTLETGDLSPI